MANIIFFSFRGTFSEKVLNALPVSEKYFILSNLAEIDVFIQRIAFLEPDFVIGFGDYSGKDQDRLRIETICTNKFRKSLPDSNLIELGISEFLIAKTHSKYAKRIGNSFCNLISYRMMQKISHLKLETKYAFVHIPKTFQIDTAVDELKSILSFR